MRRKFWCVVLITCNALQRSGVIVSHRTGRPGTQARLLTSNREFERRQGYICGDIT